MSEVLKLAQLAEDNRVAEVKIRSARVTSELHAEGRIGFDGSFELLHEILFRDYLGSASLDQIHLFMYAGEQFLSDSPVSLFCVVTVVQCHAWHLSA
jgi:hypothetical protein